MTESEDRALCRLVAMMAVVVSSHLAEAGDNNWEFLEKRLREWEDARGVQRARKDAPASPSGRRKREEPIHRFTLLDYLNRSNI